MANPFKNAAGQRKLRSLFYEEVGADKTGVVYTLKSQDHEGYPSLYRLYMEADDPTEYTFAVHHLDSWEHWEMLSSAAWFKPYITKWRRELEVKHKAKALLNITALANTPEAKEAFQANKFLLSYKENTTRRKGAGRPSKEEVAAAAKAMADEANSLNDDLARVTGNLN